MKQNDLTSKLQRLSAGLNMLKGEEKGLIFNLRSVSKLNRIKNMINKVDFLQSKTIESKPAFRKLTSQVVNFSDKKWTKEVLNFD